MVQKPRRRPEICFGLPLRLGLLALIGTLLSGLPATAQDWATRDACAVTRAEVRDTPLPASVQAAIESDGQRHPNDIGRFWRIESADGAVSHLWGTLHSTDPLILDLPERVEATIDTARVIAPEPDFTHSSRASITRSHTYEGWLREKNSPLWRFETENTGIPQQIIARIRARTDGIGWGRDAPDYLTFGGLASLLLNDPCDDFAAGVLPIQDARIQMLGLIAGASVMGLEDKNAFLAFLNNPKNRATALSLIRVYGSYLTPPEPGDRAAGFALYQQGRIGAMMAWDAAFLREVLGPEADLHLRRMEAYLLDARNLAFHARALPELQQGGVFMAIGSFHLPGQNGMVALLRQAGFTVTRIPLPGEVTDP